MRIGASLFLIAVGAILKFAVADQFDGVDLGMVGIILMVVGAIGLVISIIMASTRRRTDVVHQGPAAYAADGSVVAGERRTTVVEPRRDPRI